MVVIKCKENELYSLLKYVIYDGENLMVDFEGFIGNENIINEVWILFKLFFFLLKKILFFKCYFNIKVVGFSND